MNRIWKLLPIVLSVSAIAQNRSTPTGTTILTNPQQKESASLKSSSAEQEVWGQEKDYWRLLKADDREAYMKLWHEHFLGWPKYDDAPVDKESIRQELATAPTSRGKVINYELQPLSVRAHGIDVVITFYRAMISRRTRR